MNEYCKKKTVRNEEEKKIIIDEYGIDSDVAVRSYNLEIPRAISLNEAEDLIKETLIEDKKIIDA